MPVDPGPIGNVVAKHEQPSGLDAVLAGYRRTDPVVPVGAVLVIAKHVDRYWSAPECAEAALTVGHDSSVDESALDLFVSSRHAAL